MKQPNEKPSYAELAARVKISTERLKQAETAPSELMSVLSKLETLANEALSEAKTPEAQNSVYEWYNPARAKVNEIYWALWPHRTSAFQLACVAAPFVAANMDASKALVRAKSLLTLAETRLNNYRNPTSVVNDFTAEEAVKEINRRARELKLRNWKSIRPLRECLKEVVAATTKENFGELWKAALPNHERPAHRVIDLFLIRKIMDRRLKLEEAKQTKAAAGRAANASKQE